nr:hypothetical protein [Tanacetum cinerariifolium]
MSSLFGDTHNVVAILAKSDAAEGFEQSINFLSGSYIHYALTVNPHIYVSCIKQFWNTASVKRSDDVTRLQALVDRKKIVISEDVIREILQLDDAEGVVCFPNEEIFSSLAQMGYEKPSTKLTFYKAFFSSQWKFFLHTLLQSLSAKRTSWNEFSTAMASAVICLSKEEGIAEEQVQAVPAVVQETVAEDGVEFPTHLFQQVLDTCSALTHHIENLEHDKAAQKLEIIKLKARVKRLERDNKVKSSKLRRLKKVGTSKRIESSVDIKDVFNQGRMIDDLDKDEGIELAEIYHLVLDHPSKVLSMQEDDSEVQEVVEVVTTAKLITEVVTAATSQVSTASTTISVAKPSIHAAAVTAAYTRRRKVVIIRDPEEELYSKTPTETPKLKDKGKEINKDHEEINNGIDWDAAIDHVKQKSKENPQYIKRYQVIKKRPQTESEARKNMMIYLKNTAGYKLDFFKGMSYDEIRPIFQARFDANMRFLFKSREEIEEEDQEVLKSINETPAQKAAKRRKLNKEAKEVEDLKKHLEVVNDEDDDVFTKATSLARKLILLVERRYPLSKFTLEQLMNVTRLQVEEDSEMSLELLRFTRQQLQEYQQG